MHNISSPPFSREPAPSSPALVILSQSLDFLQEHPPCNNRAPEHLLQGAIFGCAHPLEAFISESVILDARAPLTNQGGVIFTQSNSTCTGKTLNEETEMPTCPSRKAKRFSVSVFVS